MAGQYPEFRAESKGTELEGIVVAQFGADKFVFVGSERANLVLVERVLDEGTTTEIA